MRAHPQPGVDLTYVKRTGEANGDAGDQYTGLDRFGRVVDQRWLVASSGTATDRFRYGYDRDSNRLYRDNVVNTAFGELYHSNGATAGYDPLNQLTDFRRGLLSDTNADNVPDTVATATRSQGWTLDAPGNWSSVTTDGSTQTRGHNQQNQITSVSGQTTPAYDANGNLTTDQTGKTLIYDAWNRLVQVKQGATTLASYGYDAQGRRVVENSGTARDLYYSTEWQVLEERVGSQVQVQQVWSPIYVDALVERDRDADGNAANGLEERLYVQQDANWNVTALVSAAGVVQERYAYDPYGQGIILDPAWSTRTATAFAWVYLHQGGRFEVTTGLYHFRAREYSPALGRWLSVDPVGLGGRDVNLYRYVGNAPLGATDPSGLIGVFMGGAGEDMSHTTGTIRHLSRRYAPQEKARWYETPGIFAFDATGFPFGVINLPADIAPAYKAIVEAVKEARSKRNCPLDTERVDLFGYSRGGFYSIKLAQQLNTRPKRDPAIGDSIPVTFLGVIDPIASGDYKGTLGNTQAWGWFWPLEVPENVQVGWAAQKDSAHNRFGWLAPAWQGVEFWNHTLTGKIEIHLFPYNHYGIGHIDYGWKVRDALMDAAAETGVQWGASPD